MGFLSFSEIMSLLSTAGDRDAASLLSLFPVILGLVPRTHEHRALTIGSPRMGRRNKSDDDGKIVFGVGAKNRLREARGAGI
jgi:hypothetical protein